MKKHPNKHIREAIDYAVEVGMLSTLASQDMHFILGHTEHQMSVWSTPKDPETHAKQILRKLKQCNGDEL